MGVRVGVGVNVLERVNERDTEDEGATVLGECAEIGLGNKPVREVEVGVEPGVRGDAYSRDRVSSLGVVGNPSGCTRVDDGGDTGGGDRKRKFEPVDVDLFDGGVLGVYALEPSLLFRIYMRVAIQSAFQFTEGLYRRHTLGIAPAVSLALDIFSFARFTIPSGGNSRSSTITVDKREPEGVLGADAFEPEND